MALTQVTAGLLDNSTQTYGMKNRIINGAMVIDQRNAGASVSSAANGTYFVDRWRCSQNQNSKFSVQQNAGAVTPPTGFTNYLGITSSSAYSVLTGDYITVGQRVEGFNAADLSWGSAGAQSVSLSFWVRSSLTGTFGGAVANSSSNRSYPFTYTVNATNTWEQKTITIAGDTSGTWLTTNGIGIALYFNLGTGSTFSGTAGAWAGADYVSATGATSVVGTSGATFYITGVQLEKGSTATSFDYRPYGTELALCQRYAIVCDSNNGFDMRVQGSSAWVVSLYYPVWMRATPSLIVSSLGTYKNTAGAPGTNQYQFINISSGGSVTWGTAPTTLSMTTQDAKHTYIYQNSGATPSEAVTGQMYNLTMGLGSSFTLSAEL